MQNKVLSAIRATGYKIPCAEPELSRAFFARGQGVSSYKAARLACAGCKLRPECLADDLSGVIAQIDYGDHVTNRPRATGYARKYDFSAVTAGLLVEERVTMANWAIDNGVKTVTVEVARLLLGGGIEAAKSILCNPANTSQL